MLSNKSLPAFEEIELKNKHESIGAMIQKLWETVEVQAIHIHQLNLKNKLLEEKLNSLEERIEQ
jgi:hypothetical protein